MSVDKQKIINLGLSVLEIESRSISELTNKINDSFVEACLTLLECKGRVVVTGIGKSGHIANKIAATLASTGTPAFFLHPAEASHGDLGMITPNDVVLSLSYSGETNELATILPLIKRLDVKIIAMCGSDTSTMAKYSDILLDVSIHKEACPLGLAPTASTTAMLAMGDALAVSVLEARGFTMDDFAKSHPGGQLGRRLLLKIKDVMHTGNDIPRITEDALLMDALIEMSAKRLGFTTIVAQNDPDSIVGIFTDGDLRRTLSRGLDIHKTPISDVMTKKFTAVTDNQLAAEAVPVMEKLKILVLPVLDENKKLAGALNMHDLFKAGIV